MLSITRISSACEVLAKRPVLIKYVKDTSKLSQLFSTESLETEVTKTKNATMNKKLEEAKTERQMSSAMRMYLKRKKEQDSFMAKERADFEIGKQHLANMMGLDPENISQEQIDSSIEYLFPSGRLL